MKKLILSIAFIIIVNNLYSQAVSGNQIIAEGLARIKVKPDIANFTIQVTKQNNVEKVAITALNIETLKVEKILRKIGLSEKNIKITDYRVSKNDYNQQNEVTATNTICVELLIDNKLIERMYQEIQNENLADFNINFEARISTVLEKEQRVILVKNAIENAKENALNMANALEIKLLNIKLVSKYGIENDLFSTRTITEIKHKNIGFKDAKGELNENPKTLFDKFEVNEIELEETVTIVYEIEKK